MKSLDLSVVNSVKEYDCDTGFIHEIVKKFSKQENKNPSMYQVLLLNDDFTPMDFVVTVLQSCFGMSVDQATKVMMEVHQKGQAICGLYTKDVAETKAYQVNRLSRAEDYPLLCTISKVG